MPCYLEKKSNKAKRTYETYVIYILSAMTTVPMELDLGTGYEYIYIFYMKFWSSVITNMATL